MGDVPDRGKTRHFWRSARFCRLRAVKKTRKLIKTLIIFVCNFLHDQFAHVLLSKIQCISLLEVCVSMFVQAQIPTKKGLEYTG